MSEKTIVYAASLGVLSGGFLLCIPFPGLSNALGSFGLSVGGLFGAYCGSHIAEGLIHKGGTENAGTHEAGDRF